MDKLSGTSSASANNQYRRQQDSGMESYSENVFYVRGDLSAIQHKFKKGQILDARIILCLGDHKYLLRFLGSNYVMESKLSFKRFAEVKVEVEETEPKLKLKMLPLLKRTTAGLGKTDITI